MTIEKAQKWANKILNQKNIFSSALDAEILLAFVLKKPKEYLYAHPFNNLTIQQFNNFKKLISRRIKHEPVAYITGHKEFYGLNFLVNKKVLIPRPETELLVEETIKIVNNLTIKQFSNLAIFDVGTGSGCIAIALAKNLPRAKIIATDISKSALRLAKQNARRHGVSPQITFLRGNLLEPILKIPNFKFLISNFIIVANLPYLTTKEWQRSQPEIRKYEPRQALDAGPDGLKYFRELFEQIITYNLQPKSLIFEIGYNQAPKIKKLTAKLSSKGAKRQGIPRECETAKLSSKAERGIAPFKIEIKKDLAGFDRVIVIQKKEQNFSLR